MGKYTPLVILQLFLIFFSCSTPRPEGATEAEILYKEALDFVEHDRYLLATEKLNLLRSKHPYSFYSTHAELLQADIYFKQESYAEAAAAYILFKDFHPKHERMDYVLWQIAESFFLQIPSTFDRDLASAFEAIKYYNELVEKYSKSEYVGQSAPRIEKCYQMIQQKEQYIADFYFKTKVFDAAKFRYQLILDTFSEEAMRNHAMVRILQSMYQLGEFAECTSRYKSYQQLAAPSIQGELQKINQQCLANHK